MKPTGARVSTARLQPKLNRKDNAMPKITRRPPCHLMVCPNCASSDVAIDATAKWDVEAQEWELSSTQDTITCQACGSEGYEAEFQTAGPAIERLSLSSHEIDMICDGLVILSPDTDAASDMRASLLDRLGPLGVAPGTDAG